jgi:hypothetical protein
VFGEKWAVKDAVSLCPDAAGYGELRYMAVDTAPLKGKRLNCEAEKLYEKHDDIDWNLERQEWIREGGPPEAAYRATHRQVVELVGEAERLLARAAIDDDHTYWLDKLRKARQAIAQSEQKARSGDYKLALSYQEGAFTLAHSVIDKMRNSGRTKDGLPDEIPPYKSGDAIRLKSGKRTLRRAGVAYPDDNWGGCGRPHQARSMIWRSRRNQHSPSTPPSRRRSPKFLLGWPCPVPRRRTQSFVS